MSFTLAHLSDVHLPNLATRDVFRNFKGKRVIGGMSWLLNRRRQHLLKVAAATQASIISEKPDHIALTGDVVNIAARDEFPAAARWISALGAADTVSFVPGNHDAYVHVPWSKGLAHFAPWMKPDRHDPTNGDMQFPYVRMRRNIALIGLNSGQPQNYFKAAGAIGPQQLRDLEHILTMLGQQGFYRIVMIHHPPLPLLAKPRKALVDADKLQDTLKTAGCELVLHGHNHRSMLNWIETRSGPTPVVGVPSASLRGDAKHEAGGWNRYNINRIQGQWTTEMIPFRWNNETQQMDQKSKVTLSPPSATIEAV